MASRWHRLLETARWNLSRHRASRLFCRFTPLRSSLLLCFPFAPRIFLPPPLPPSPRLAFLHLSATGLSPFFPFNDLCFHENFIISSRNSYRGVRSFTSFLRLDVAFKLYCFLTLNRLRFNGIYCLLQYRYRH